MNKAHTYLVAGLLVICGSLPQAVSANDNLALCGVVTSVDSRNNEFVVQVSTSSCEGERKFTSDNPRLVTPKDTNRYICFEIDSSVCSNNFVYTVTKRRGE